MKMAPGVSGMPDSAITSPRPQLKHRTSFVELDSLESNDPELKKPPKTRFTKDPEGELTYDETTVDVVTVPCPGGDALRSWNRDGLMSRYFGAPSMRDPEVEKTGFAPSWVRQGIRREADVARILLYEHPDVEAGSTLGALADVFLEELRAVRVSDDDGGKMQRQRPLLFLGHSVGGIVVKIALAKASRDARYEDILRDCYGVAFFGTPHQGSSYFAMPSLASSIQSLLQLSKPLPTSITDDLRVGNRLLTHADEDFKAISHDLRVWTLYETIDSRLSGGSSADGDGNVYFTAPLASMKSAILGMRQEHIFPLQADHANVASFGRSNQHTLRLFLRQLASLISRADASVREDRHGGRWTLNLEQRVNVEVHGFFEDPASANGGEETLVRAWSTKLPLKEFLRKGPEECLIERLNEVEGIPEESRFLRAKGKTMSLTEVENQRMGRNLAAKEGLGIKNQLIQQVSPPTSPILRPIEPDILATSSANMVPIRQRTRRLSSPPPQGTTHRISTPTRYSTPMRRTSPLIRADFDQDLAIDRLSPVPRPRSIMSFGRSISDQSPGVESSDFPPFFQPRSRSSIYGEGREDEDVEPSEPLPEAVLAIRKVVGDFKNRVREKVIVGEVPVAFVKPDVSKRKFVWVHLPYNNPSWVKNIIETLQVSYKRDYSALFNHDFWTSKHTRGRHSQHYAYYAKPGCYYTAPFNFSPSVSPLTIDDAISISLFLPYLHFDSYKRLIRRRNVILQRMGRGRARPVPEEIAKSDSIENQVIWEFLGHDPPINCRRTLDQYGYPSLRDTRSRDDDQMLYKLTKDRGCKFGDGHDIYAHSSNSRDGSYGSGGSWKERMAREADLEEIIEDDGVLNGNVLMVDQMWLWVIQSHTLLSFFPKRESDPIEGPLYQQADLRDSIFNEVNVDLTRQCENALDLAALSALHAVSVLLDRASHPDLEVFRIFEEAISVLTEKLTSSLKAFRVEGFRDKASEYEPVENKERSIRAHHKEQGRLAEKENRDNTSALLELRDLEDELLVLLNLFDQQHGVLDSMFTAYSTPQLIHRTVRGRAFLKEGMRRLGEYKRRAEEMGGRVRSTRDDYDKLLQMVQRQAQVDEVRLSRLHADLASAQSRSVMIFTIFTVIFLPLTFFTGLFGMNTREWEAETPTLGFIGAIALPSSFAIIALSLIAAFSTQARRFLQWIGDIVSEILRWIYDLSVRPVADIVFPIARRVLRTPRGQIGEEKREGRRGGLKKEASDFWERHRLEREKGYQIPEVNKKGVGRKRSIARVRKDGRR